MQAPTPSIAASIEFLNFLREAKISSYAAQGDSASTLPLLPGSKQLEYQVGEFCYRDIYVGMEQFCGQEIIYQAGKPIWSMVYSGGLLPASNPSAPALSNIVSTYSFLREALRQVPNGLPLRGPVMLSKQDLKYLCTVNGAITRFDGVEQIFSAGERTYELHFSGGMLQ
jgi:hypothetical protein